MAQQNVNQTFSTPNPGSPNGDGKARALISPWVISSTTQGQP